MKTESFLSKTSDLSNAEFTATLLEDQSIPKPKIHSLDGRKYTPEPAETMRYVVSLALQNENIMSRLIREVKRNGGLAKLVSELFNHNETFAVIEEVAANDSRVNRKINEAVAEPRGMSGGSPAGPNGASAGRTPMVKNGGGMGAAPPGPPSEGEEMPGNLLDDEEGGEGEEDEDMGDEDMGDEDMGDENDEEGDEGEEDGEDEEEGKHTHIHVHNHHHHKGNKMKGDMEMPPMKNGI